MCHGLPRSLPSIGRLVGLLLVVGVAAVIWLDAQTWFAAVLPIVMIGIQYLVHPLFTQWPVPATVIPHDGSRYEFDHVRN